MHDTITKSQLGRYVRRARLTRRLSTQGLAAQLGYAPDRVNKGARRILRIEEDGLERPDFIERVLDQLDLDPAVAERLAAADEEACRLAWERWADKPIRPYMVVRYAAISFGHVSRELPEHLRTEPQQVAWVAGFLDAENRRRALDAKDAPAVSKGRRAPEPPTPITAQLIVSRRLSLWIDETGRVTSRTVNTYRQSSPTPCIRVGNKTFVFGAD